MHNRKTDYLPQVRCSPALRLDLEKVAAQSITPNIADHIRYAVTLYIDQMLQEDERQTSPSPQAVPGQQPAA